MHFDKKISPETRSKLHDRSCWPGMETGFIPDNNFFDYHGEKSKT